MKDRKGSIKIKNTKNSKKSGNYRASTEEKETQ